MSDEIFVPRGKMRKRKRKSEGDDIFQALTKDKPMLELGKDRGLKCREDNKWIPWKDVWFKYEIQSNDLMRLCICPYCENVLRTDNMSGYEAHVEVEARTPQGPKGKRVLICGSRDWTDVTAISKVMKQFDPHTTVLVCGMARGADVIAYRLAKGLGWNVMEFPANWEAYSTKEKWRAGHDRNKAMLREGKPELVIAFKDGFDKTMRRGGTENMVKLAKLAKVRVRLVKHKVQS